MTEPIPNPPFKGELTIIWDKEKAELLCRLSNLEAHALDQDKQICKIKSQLSQLERNMASIVSHLWEGHQVENKSRLVILEDSVRFWSNQTMNAHLEKLDTHQKVIADLATRVLTLENYILNLKGANVTISRS